MTRRLHAAPGITLIEITVVVFIVALLAFFGARSWGIKGERDHNARMKLTEIWTAEKRFYAFKGRYTDSWQELTLQDPTSARPGDYAFSLALTQSGDNFSAGATPVSGGAALQIDRAGAVTTGP